MSILFLETKIAKFLIRPWTMKRIIWFLLDRSVEWYQIWLIWIILIRNLPQNQLVGFKPG